MSLVASVYSVAGGSKRGRTRGFWSGPPPSTHLYTRRGMLDRAAALGCDRPQDGDQDARANEGRDKRPPPADRHVDEQAQDQPADDRPDDAHDDVTEDAEAASFHHHARQRAGDTPNNDPGN